MYTVEQILDLSSEDTRIIKQETGLVFSNKIELVQSISHILVNGFVVNIPKFSELASLNTKDLINVMLTHNIDNPYSYTFGEAVMSILRDNVIGPYKQFLSNVQKKIPNDVFKEYKARFLDIILANLTQPHEKPLVTLKDIKGRLRYVESRDLPKTSVHIGQRKLFLGELQFLTQITQENKGDIIVVYAGAAPSNHTGYLAGLFPRVKFLLVDPNKFVVNEAPPVPRPLYHQIGYLKETREAKLRRYRGIIRNFKKRSIPLQIMNEYFTDDLATVIGEEMGKHYFISDIRTSHGESVVHTYDIIWNSAMQFNWNHLMKPVLTMFKFRLPFYMEDNSEFHEHVGKNNEDFLLSKKYGIDFVENFDRKEFIYFDGVVNIQCFPGTASTETRLVTNGSKLKNYGKITDYENAFNYYNTLERWSRLHENENASSVHGFDHCNDCALENLIWKEYKEVTNSKKSVLAYVNELSAILGRSLKKDSHGNFFATPKL